MYSQWQSREKRMSYPGISPAKPVDFMGLETSSRAFMPRSNSRPPKVVEVSSRIKEGKGTNPGTRAVSSASLASNFRSSP